MAVISTFDLVPTWVIPSTGSKSITLADDTSYTALLSGGAHNGILKVTGPNGSIYTNAGYLTNSFVAPDTKSANSYTKTGIVPVPLDSNGKILKGYYTFDYKVQCTTANGTGTVNSMTSGTKLIVLNGGTDEFNLLVAQIAEGTWTFAISGSGTAANNKAYTIDETYTPVYGGGFFTFRVNESFTTQGSGGNWNGTTVYTTSYSVNYQACYATLCIEQSYDCYCSKFTSTDATNYSVNGATYTIVTKEHRIKYPTGIIPAIPDLVSTDTSINTITTSPLYTKGWTTVMTTNVLYDWDTYFVDYTYYGTKDVEVVCDNELCGIQTCLENLYAAWLDASNNNPAEAAKYQFKLNKITYLLAQYQVAIDCGDTQAAADYVTAIKVVLDTTGCSCGCGCSESDAPEMVVGFCGTTATSTANVQIGTTEGSGITITSEIVNDVTIYTLSIDQTVIGEWFGGKVLLINGTGATQYATITLALAAASSGDVIRVCAGSYSESIEVSTEGITIEVEAGVTWTNNGARANITLDGVSGFSLIGYGTLEYNNTVDGVIYTDNPSDFSVSGVFLTSTSSAPAVYVEGATARFANCNIKASADYAIQSLDCTLVETLNCKLYSGTTDSLAIGGSTVARVYSTFSNADSDNVPTFGAITVDSGLTI